MEDVVYLDDAREIARVVPHYRYDRGQVVLCVGRRGYGKTTAMKAFIDCCEPRVFGIDMFGDFNLEPAADIEDAIDRMDVRVKDGLFETERYAPARVSVRPDNIESTHQFGSEVFQAAIDDLRNCLVVMDEVTLWTTPYTGARNTDDPFTKLVLQGRRLGLRIIAGVQRFTLFPQLLQAEISHLVVFRTSAKPDIDRIADWTSDEIAQDARKLDVGECIVVAL
jgi:hypothetical protein